MRLLQLSGFVVGAVLLAGCGNLQTVKSFSTPYKEPDGGERARIRVVADGMVRAVPQSACVDWRIPNSGVMVADIKGFADQNNKSLGMPATRSSIVPSRVATVVAEFYVPANQPLTLAYLSNGRMVLGAQQQCRVNKTFIPQAGQDYEASFFQVLDTSFFSTHDKCLSVVTQMTPDASGPLGGTLVELHNAPLCRKSDML